LFKHKGRQEFKAKGLDIEIIPKKAYEMVDNSEREYEKA
jgi:hypothetical protein